MNSNILLILLPFCVFGFTYLLRYQYGPFGILMKVRILFGVKYSDVLDNDGNVVDYEEEIPFDNSWAKLFGCFWCLSTWVSIVFSAIFCFVYKFSILEWIIITFCNVGFAGYLHERIDT